MQCTCSSLRSYMHPLCSLSPYCLQKYYFTGIHIGKTKLLNRKVCLSKKIKKTKWSQDLNPHLRDLSCNHWSICPPQSTDVLNLTIKACIC